MPREVLSRILVVVVGCDVLPNPYVDDARMNEYSRKDLNAVLDGISCFCRECIVVCWFFSIKGCTEIDLCMCS